MEGLVVERVRTVWDLMHPQRLLNLVDHISTHPPYSYLPGEISATADWFPEWSKEQRSAWSRCEPPITWALLHRAAAGDLRKARPLRRKLGIDPATTAYIAELGVAPQARRGGIASRLLDEALQSCQWGRPRVSYGPWSATNPPWRSTGGTGMSSSTR
jgi:GNAT superfamily N-acetyltransferase